METTDAMQQADRPTRRQALSLTPNEHTALRVLSQRERGSLSATVGRLIRAEMERRFGLNWTGDPLPHEPPSGAES